MTYNTEPASQQTLMAFAGGKPADSCTSADPGCLFFPHHGWMDGYQEEATQTPVFWHFQGCGISSAGSIPGRQVSRQCLVISRVRELTTS